MQPLLVLDCRSLLSTQVLGTPDNNRAGVRLKAAKQQLYLGL